jgi:hypothetical protein
VHDAAIALRALYPLEPSSRAMAAARGFAPVDDRIVRQQLVALLEGDRDELAAATTRLLAMRDAASARLAYEFAGDVQTRIAALAWISDAPCARVARQSAQDVLM